MRREQPPPILTVEAAVLAALRLGGATMPQLAKTTRRTITGVRSALLRLQEDGLVRSKLEEVVTNGRPADLWLLTASGVKMAERQRREMQELAEAS